MLEIQHVEARDAGDAAAVLLVVGHDPVVARNAQHLDGGEAPREQVAQFVGRVFAHVPRIARERHRGVGRRDDELPARAQHAVHLAHEVHVAPDVLDYLERDDEVEAPVGKGQRRHRGLHVAHVRQAGQTARLGNVFVEGDEAAGVRRDDLHAVARAGADLEHVAVDALRRRVVREQRTLEYEVVRSLRADALGRCHASHSVLPFDSDPLVGRFDGTAFEQHAQRALEDLFACAREACHLLRGAVVVQRQESAVVAQQAEQLLGRILDLGVALALEAYVDAVVLGDAAHVTRQGVAHGHRPEQLVAVEHAPVAVVDDDAEADGALRRHEQPHLLARRNGDELVVDERLELHRHHAAARDAVLVEVDHVAVVLEDAALLVAVRQEEVLAVQPPVEEGAVRGLVHDAQEARLARPQQRRFGRRHEPVLRVVVEEDLLRVAGFVGERYIAVREQYLLPLVVREVETVVRQAAYGECLCASCLEHKCRFSRQKYVLFRSRATAAPARAVFCRFKK